MQTQSLSYGDYTIYSWDLNESDKGIPIWRYYFEGAKALIFVVDSTNRDLLPSAREELHKITALREFEDCPVIVFANKQDVKGSATIQEIKDAMDLKGLKQQKQYIVASDAVKGDMVDYGMKWVESAIRL